MDRRNSPLKVAIIFRGGPVAADRDWLVTLLESVSPDVLGNDVRLSVHPLFPWREGVADLCLALAARLTDDESFPRLNLGDTVGAEVRSPDGVRAYNLKLY